MCLRGGLLGSAPPVPRPRVQAAHHAKVWDALRSSSRLVWLGDRPWGWEVKEKERQVLGEKVMPSSQGLSPSPRSQLSHPLPLSKPALHPVCRRSLSVRALLVSASACSFGLLRQLWWMS